MSFSRYSLYTVQFDTKNLSFRQVMGNGLRYHVPKFQRDYSWQEEQWEDLWQDLIEIVNTEPSSHYMGYLVLQTSDNTNFKVIDGQQRLTTISILILATLYELKDLQEDTDENKKRMEAIKGSFIGFTDPVSLQLTHKLNLNRNNDSHFKSYLCDLLDPPLRNTNRSEKLLSESLEYFRKKIQDYFTKPIKGQKMAQFIESIVKKLTFTVITVGNDTNAYIVFETLNARGVQLSTPDLVKNYVFSLIDKTGSVHEEQLKNLEDKWSRIIGQLGENKFSHFIRIDWNSRYEFSRKNELFKKIKSQLQSQENAISYLHTLQKNSQIYSALQSDEDEFWKRYKQGLYNKQKLKNSLRMLNLFNIVAPQSVLIAAFHKFNPQDFIKFLYYIETLSVRYNIIGNKSTGSQEKIYSETARIIEKSLEVSLKTVLNHLRKIYPSNEEFRNDFEFKSFKTKQTTKKVRYFLYRIESYLNSSPSLDQFSLEHILPQNFSKSWLKNFDRKDRIEDFIDRIGNMTLLSYTQNQDSGNDEFEKKKQHFQDSPFEITKKCLSYENWDANAISDRQKWLAKQAQSIWCFPDP